MSNAVDSEANGTGDRDDKGRDGSGCNGTKAKATQLGWEGGEVACIMRKRVRLRCESL